MDFTEWFLDVFKKSGLNQTQFALRINEVPTLIMACRRHGRKIKQYKLMKRLRDKILREFKHLKLKDPLKGEK